MGAGEGGGGGVSGAYFRGMPIWGGFLLHWGLRGLLRPLLVRRGGAGLAGAPDTSFAVTLVSCYPG